MMHQSLQQKSNGVQGLNQHSSFSGVLPQQDSSPELIGRGLRVCMTCRKANSVMKGSDDRRTEDILCIRASKKDNNNLKSTDSWVHFFKADSNSKALS